MGKVNKMSDYQPPSKKTGYNLRSRPNREHGYFLRSKARVGQIVTNNEANEHTIKRKVIRKVQFNLIQLNADCLLKIFEYLNVIELAKIADTNISLRQLAKYQFYLKYGSLNFDNLKMNRSITLQEVTKIFRNFGNSISSLELSIHSFVIGSDQQILSLIGKYCKPSTLKKLVLTEIRIPNREMKKLGPLFGELEHLSLIKCDCDIQFNPIDGYTRLKTLELNLHFTDHFMNRINFPQLEYFYLYQCDWVSSLQRSNFLGFVLNHPNLKTLSIRNGYTKMHILEAIGKNMKKLEHFTYDCHIQDMLSSKQNFEAALQPLGSMKSLKTLALHCHCSPIENLFESFIANNIEIESLHLKDIRLSEDTVQNLKKLKTIKILKFQKIRSQNVDTFISIAKDLPYLNEFHLELDDSTIPIIALKTLLSRANELTILKIDSFNPNNNIDAQLYLDMVDIVKKRSNSKRLEIVLYVLTSPVNVPQNILDENREWINILIINSNDETLFIELDDNDTDTDESDMDFDDEIEDDMEMGGWSSDEPFGEDGFSDEEL